MLQGLLLTISTLQISLTSCNAQTAPSTASASLFYQVSTSRSVMDAALPTFSMTIEVEINEDESTYDPDYYTKGAFAETLEKITQLHLKDIFEHREYESLAELTLPGEEFIDVKLASKIRVSDGTADDDNNSVTSDNILTLHAGFTGTATFSFPTDQMPTQGRLDLQSQEVLEQALSGKNYLLLVSRYISTSILYSIQDVKNVFVGTELLNIVVFDDTNNDSSSIAADALSTSQQKESTGSNSSSSDDKLNPIAIVAISIMISLFCALALFGVAVVMLLLDRSKQEKALNGQTMDSLGMGTKKNTDNKDGSDEDSEEEDKEDAAWKQAVLKVLSKALMVRRYWKRAIRKAKKMRRQEKRKRDRGNATSATEATTSDKNTDKSGHADKTIDIEDSSSDDDSLTDDIYYDEHLTDEEAANQWLDTWTQSLTSIPLRSMANTRSHNQGNPTRISPQKRKKKASSSRKTILEPRPATRQSARMFLSCIAEEDSVVDGSSVAAAKSAEADLEGTIMSIENPAHRDRIRDMAQAILQDEYPAAMQQQSSASPGMFGASARRKRRDIVVDEKKEEEVRNTDRKAVAGFGIKEEERENTSEEDDDDDMVEESLV